jgi:mannosyltransferase
VARDYKVFMHVRDAAGNIVFQQDKVTLSSLLPTHTWAPGVTRRDAYAVVIPRDLPAGRYSVVIGLYDPLQNIRMNSPEGDVVTLGVIEITGR